MTQRLRPATISICCAQSSGHSSCETAGKNTTADHHHLLVHICTNSHALGPAEPHLCAIYNGASERFNLPDSFFILSSIVHQSIYETQTHMYVVYPLFAFHKTNQINTCWLNKRIYFREGHIFQLIYMVHFACFVETQHIANYQSSKDATRSAGLCVMLNWDWWAARARTSS